MTRKNVIELLGLIRIGYPRFYSNLTKEDALATIELWLSMFKDCEYELVKTAVQSLINSSEYPPTIADVKNEMYKLNNIEGDNSIDEWNAIRKAIKSSIYYSVENFNSLPPIAKRFVGSPNQLREWAMSDNFNDGVIRGQFMKQYETLAKRKKYVALMTPEVREFIQKLTEKKDVKMLEK